MIRLLGSRWVLGLFSLLVGFGCGTEPWAWAAHEGSQSFVAQGAAPLQPNNRAQSRAQALEDLLRQAVWQAVGTLVSGQELSQKSQEIRKDVLSQAERYAQSFKILDEYVDGDLYRVQGSVGVALETLRADLEKLGMIDQVPLSAKEGGQSASKEAAFREESGPAAPFKSEDAALGPARQKSLQKRILWVVAENWNGLWSGVSKDTFSAEGGLGQWVADEASDYGWQMEFPAEMPRELPLTEEQIQPWMEEARRQGASHLVVGTGQKTGNALAVWLKVMDVVSGRVMGTVEEQVSAFGEDFMEGLLLLAEMTVSKMEAMFTQGSLPGRVFAKPASTALGTATPNLQEGVWEIAVKGDASYAAWLAMEEKLLERSKAFAVDSMVLETNGVKVRTKNVNPEAVMVLDGLRVGPTMVLRVEGMDPSARMVTFAVESLAVESEIAPAQESKTP
ncbi:hypothetical protein [Desulfosoma caldarium]|uniref:LPP20 lipoprotein n=1 Tax=Desulfosoma caldarium TaxID=610254 RepID=A0A3N1VFC6_9BACT|nr:hypothetical protein [Desulfosoma caldarium]ROR01556.1 hypothetical protein EDC27_0735 [Desulfosoma caldarium]